MDHWSVVTKIPTSRTLEVLAGIMRLPQDYPLGSNELGKEPQSTYRKCKAVELIFKNS
jgi:hypothetical protein